jgi:hypothetical protein
LWPCPIQDQPFWLARKTVKDVNIMTILMPISSSL